MAAKDSFFYQKNTLNINGKLLDLHTPKIMGIVNVTPDSFFDGGNLNSDSEILRYTEKILSEGADIIDVGGYSSRPGSSNVGQDEELKRVIPAIKIIKTRFPDSIISIDTFRSDVARASFDVGADMVNDISGGSDEKMFATVAENKMPYIFMHMIGTPEKSHSETGYNDLFGEMMNYFKTRVETLSMLGFNDIIIDPGIGFSKSIEQNYEILRNLDYFKALNLPLLVGVSRKSLIHKVLSLSPEEALNGTTVLNTIALLKGAAILRVHDIIEAKQTVELIKRLNN